MPKGIFSIKLLFDKFKWFSNVKLEGIWSKSWFIEKSIDSKEPIVPIFTGILPIKRLYDKFNDGNSWRLVTSSRISPDKLFLKKSIFFTSWRMVLHSRIFFLYHKQCIFKRERFTIRINWGVKIHIEIWITFCGHGTKIFNTSWYASKWFFMGKVQNLKWS